MLLRPFLENGICHLQQGGWDQDGQAMLVGSVGVLFLGGRDVWLGRGQDRGKSKGRGREAGARAACLRAGGEESWGEC